MRNIKLAFQYDGTNFCGFELQPGQRSIRGEIEKALYKLFGQKTKIISASRTDAGVHALQNAANFHLDHSIPTAKIADALNSVLPKEIRIIKAEAKAKNYHARYDAKSKVYEYLIYNGAEIPPHLLKLTWHVKQELNLSAMRKAAKVLLGKHDFSSFCASRSDDKNKVRILHKFVISHSKLVIWNGCKLSVVSCKLKGNGFLYKMVRNIVGTLVEVGLGKFPPMDVKRILKAKDRRKAGRCAPAQGLCLLKVNY